MNTLPPPPDGSPLASLACRRGSLGDPTIAYRLPDEGLLVAGDGWSAAITAEHLVIATVEGAETLAELRLEERASLEPIWLRLWRSPLDEAAAPSVLLRYRGAFRPVSPPHDEGVQQWLTSLIAD